MGDYRVTDRPEVQARYAQAAPELLDMLERVVYPALRSDPTNDIGRHPVSYERGGWYIFEIETPSGGLYHLLYQVVEDERQVMVFDLVTFRGPG